MRVEEDLAHYGDDPEVIYLDRPQRREIFNRDGWYASGPTHLSVVEMRLAALNLGVRTFDTPVRALLVGENPGKRTHPDMPLFPWPDTTSAGRLLMMSQLTAGQYLGHLVRRNLCDTRGEFDRRRARQRARSILTALFDREKDLRVVMCGIKVAEAFGVDPTFWTPLKLESRQTAVVIPHPSGLNRLYNADTSRRATRAWMRWAALGESVERQRTTHEGGLAKRVADVIVAGAATADEIATKIGTTSKQVRKALREMGARHDDGAPRRYSLEEKKS